jgi:hypothetical protein
MLHPGYELAALTAPSMSTLVAILHAMPYLLGGAFCLFMLYGFWRGLGLREHAPGHRASESPDWRS